MTRYSTIRVDKIEYGYWLVFGADGDVRMSRGEPTTGRGEVAMSCIATLPRTLFSKPTLSAKVTIAEGEPTSFTVDVQAASEALKSALGVDVDVRVLTDV